VAHGLLDATQKPRRGKHAGECRAERQEFLRRAFQQLDRPGNEKEIQLLVDAVVPTVHLVHLPIRDGVFADEVQFGPKPLELRPARLVEQQPRQRGVEAAVEERAAWASRGVGSAKNNAGGNSS